MDATEENDSGSLEDAGAVAEGGDETQGQQQESGTETPAAASAEGTPAKQPPPTRAERRDMWKEKHAAEKQARAAAEENRRLRETIEKLSANVDRMAPKAPGPRDEARERWLKVAKGLDPNDPQSMQEFLDATTGYTGAHLQDDLVKKVVEQIQGQLPASQPPPVVQRILNEFDWAAEDPELQEEIALETRRAARKRNISLDGIKPAVLHSLMREGAIAVARANGLPIPGANGRDGTALGRLSGTSGRTGASGGGGVPTVDSETRARIIDATSNLGGEYRGKSPEERVAIFVKKRAADFRA